MNFGNWLCRSPTLLTLWNSVRFSPGRSAVTFPPESRNSLKLVTNALVAAYTDSYGPGWKIATLDTLKIHPDRRSYTTLMARRDKRTKALAFRAISS